MKKRLKRRIRNSLIVGGIAIAGIVSIGIYYTSHDRSNAPVAQEEASTEDTLTEDISAEDTEVVSNEEEIFQSFLDGTAEALIDTGFQNDLSYICMMESDYEKPENNKYTFDGLQNISLDALKKAVDETPDMTFPDEKLFYGFMETKQGKKVLAVKFQNMGIYDSEDDSYAAFFFCIKDDKLYLVAAFDSWARNSTVITNNLVFHGYGSAGAGDNFEWYNYIDENGQYRKLYSLETLYDDWVAMYDYDDFGMDTEWSQGCVCYLLTTEEGDFYACETSDAVDNVKYNTFTGYLESQGKKKIDNMEAALDDIYKESKLSQNQSEFTDWIRYTP